MHTWLIISTVLSKVRDFYVLMSCLGNGARYIVAETTNRKWYGLSNSGNSDDLEWHLRSFT